MGIHNLDVFGFMNIQTGDIPVSEMQCTPPGVGKLKLSEVTGK